MYARDPTLLLVEERDTPGRRQGAETVKGLSPRNPTVVGSPHISATGYKHSNPVGHDRPVHRAISHGDAAVGPGQASVCRIEHVSIVTERDCLRLAEDEQTCRSQRSAPIGPGQTS